MAWLTTNWFWLLMVLAFIGMHLFGHGGHRGHGGHGGKGAQCGHNRQRADQVGDKNDDEASPAETGRSSGHQH